MAEVWLSATCTRTVVIERVLLDRLHLAGGGRPQRLAELEERVFAVELASE
jgi:hypothetical protein